MIDGRLVIAIVDDDPRVLESLENLLESAGYCVRAFPTATALLGSDHSLVDCLITDIGMPGMDGFELQEIVRRGRPALPVFLLTGRHEATDQRFAEAKNINGFFRKPFDAQRLLADVGQVLRHVKGG